MVDKSQTVCKLCHAVKAYKGCITSNMNAHLNAFHTEILNPSHTRVSDSRRPQNPEF